MAEKYACRCCGFLTLGEEGGYEICSVCYWEDDPGGEDGGGANAVSLRDARENFATYGASEERFQSAVRVPLPEESPPKTD